MKRDSKFKTTRVSDPFYSETRKTEWTCASKLSEWMNDIILENNLGFGKAEVERVNILSKTRTDILLPAAPDSEKFAVIIEAKQPYWDVFNAELKDGARAKANQLKSPFFATTNFKTLVLWNTERANNPSIPEEEQIVQKYHLSEIEDLNEIEHPRYKNDILKGLKIFLEDLKEAYTGKKTFPKQPLDEFLVYRLHEKIRVLARYYEEIIYNRYHKDPKFAETLREWFIKQSWQFLGDRDDFKKAAHQAAYLLVNKILFYDLLRAKRPHQLDPLSIPDDLTKGSMVQKFLQAYFNEVVEGIDYETIYTTDFIDQLAFPDNENVVTEIKELVSVLNRYDFSSIGYDIIGRIFERLIPPVERHNLGQYFTSADVVDLILRFCLHHEDDKVLDPACGAGTFLVRAYQHKKMMNLRKPHQEILDTLWGCDIAKFPAHLATINLAINDLSVDKNYPNIINDDFFNLKVGEDGFDPEKWRVRRAATLGLETREVKYPRWFDAIVGNPPYTRQEEIEEIAHSAEYKNKIIKNALYDVYGKRIANIPKRAGIHAYFFVHGTKFLRNGGYFGFIVSNSWLDVDYGKGLQEFFLKNYKIIAIIESKVERWFEEADVNTCIVILQKCADKSERDNNLARFVYLKKPLREFIPPAENIWESQKKRLDEIDKLIKTILAHNEYYENDELRIFPKKQSELWAEGFDAEKQKYVGAKWGKYIRAPKIFFTILERGKDKLVPLKEVAEVETYLNTGGADGFFIVKLVQRKGATVKIKNISREGGKNVFEVESQFIKDFIKSPQELQRPCIKKKDASWALFIPDEKLDTDSLAYKYIIWGESKGFHERSGCRKRNPWWKLPKQAFSIGEILWSRIHDVRHIVFYNPYLVANTNFYSIHPKHEKSILVAAILNSTIYSLFKEVIGRVNFGQGALKTEGSDLKSMFFIKTTPINKFTRQIIINIFKKLCNRPISSIFTELGASTPEEVSLDKVKPDRRELDKIIMGEILGLSEEEQLEVYRAVVDLVKSRIDKAKSVKKTKRKTREGIDIDAFTESVMNALGEENFGKFYREKILSRDDLRTITLPRSKGKVKVEQELHGWVVRIGRSTVECASKEEAEYIAIFAEMGEREVQIPEDTDYLADVMPQFLEHKRRVDEVLESHLASVPSAKAREKLRNSVWRKIIKG